MVSNLWYFSFIDQFESTVSAVDQLTIPFWGRKS